MEMLAIEIDSHPATVVASFLRLAKFSGPSWAQLIEDSWQHLGYFWNWMTYMKL